MRNNKKKAELVKQAVQEFDISEEPVNETQELLKEIKELQQRMLEILDKLYKCLPFTKRD